MSQVYNCKACDNKLKKQRGCIRPFKKKIIWVIDDCFICNGLDKKCYLCKGTNKIPMHRCPRKIIPNRRVLKYFNYFQATEYKEYPDKRGLYYQPLRLVYVFNTLRYYNDKFTKKEIDNYGS